MFRSSWVNVYDAVDTNNNVEYRVVRGVISRTQGIGWVMEAHKAKTVRSAWVLFALSCLGVHFVVGASSQTASAASLAQSLDAGNSCNGNYLNLTAKEKTVLVSGLGLHMSPGMHRVRVFARQGAYQNAMTVPSAWTLVNERLVRSQGPGRYTPVALDDLRIAPNTTMGLMIISSHTLLYSNMADVSPYAENAELDIYSADAVCGEPFIGTMANRVWNGSVFYNDQPVCFPIKARNARFIDVCL